MENIPKELQEAQLNLQLVVDPETKCVTMKTHTDNIPEIIEIIPPEILNDPLHQPQVQDIDLDELTDLERLIFTERQRLLNLKVSKKSDASKKRNNKDAAYFTQMFETDSYNDLSQSEKSKLRMRKHRQRESSEERDLRRFRHRIITNKIRLTQKLRNFENEEFLNKIKKRNTDRVKRKRLERKLKETAEQRALRKSRVNTKSRLAKIRRQAFKTPEEILADKEKRLASLGKFWSRFTVEQRREHQRVSREKAKERKRKNQAEWKMVDKIVKGASIEEPIVRSELIEQI